MKLLRKSLSLLLGTLALGIGLLGGAVANTGEATAQTACDHQHYNDPQSRCQVLYNWNCDLGSESDWECTTS